MKLRADSRGGGEQDIRASFGHSTPRDTGESPSIQPVEGPIPLNFQYDPKVTSLEGALLFVGRTSSANVNSVNQKHLHGNSGVAIPNSPELVGGNQPLASARSSVTDNSDQSSGKKKSAVGTGSIGGRHHDPNAPAAKIIVNETQGRTLNKPKSAAADIVNETPHAEGTGVKSAFWAVAKNVSDRTPLSGQSKPPPRKNSNDGSPTPDHAGDEPIDVRACNFKFKIIRELGGGGFGKVYQAILGDGRFVAVKKMKITSHDKVIDREVRVLSTLPPHKHCVRYLGSKRSSNHYYIFMEYVSGGSIRYIRKSAGVFEEPVMRRCVKMVLEGLQHIHRHDIVHRDIKGENVLLDEKGCVKIVDFGACKVLNSGHNTVGSVGTPYWMSPEVCRGEAATEKSDVWGVGCLCLEMTNESGIPWEFHSTANNTQAVLYSIAAAKNPPKIPQHLSPAARDFIACTLRVDPKDRPTVDKLLQHPFFSQSYSAAQPVEREAVMSRVESFDFVNTISTLSQPGDAASTGGKPPVVNIGPVMISTGCKTVAPSKDKEKSQSPTYQLKAASSDDDDDYCRVRNVIRPQGNLERYPPPGTPGDEGIIGKRKKSVIATPSRVGKDEVKEMLEVTPAPQARATGVGPPADVRVSPLPNPSSSSPVRVVRAQPPPRQRRSTEASNPSSTRVSSSLTSGKPTGDPPVTNSLAEGTAKRKKTNESGKSASEPGHNDGRPSKDNPGRSNSSAWWRPKQGSDTNKSVIKWLIK